MAKIGFCKAGLEATEHPTTLDIAWAAGIFEGEGGVFGALDKRHPNSNHKNITVSVSQKDAWLGERMKALFGGSISKQKQGYSQLVGQYDPLNIWHIHGARARGFLMTIYKFLSPRRQEQVKLALA